MSIKQKFVHGQRVHHSTEKIIKVEKLDDGYKIATERRKDFVLKVKNFNNAPHVGHIITFYFISVSELIAAEVNGMTIYFIDKKDIVTAVDD